MDNENILQEIEKDSQELLESLSAIYNEEENLQTKPVVDKSREMIKKGNILLKKIQKNIKDDEYLVNGFGYHSNILYKLCTKFPLFGKTLGVPLMAVTKAAVNNLPSLGKIEREKILNLYTKLKGDKEAVSAKIELMEKKERLTNDEKEQLIMLKKMLSELNFNLKRLEFNYKLSHIEENQAKSKQPNNYTI